MGSAKAIDDSNGANKSGETGKNGQENWQDRQEVDKLADGVPVSVARRVQVAERVSLTLVCSP